MAYEFFGTLFAIVLRMEIVLLGRSGVGKSTVAASLGRTFGLSVLEADDEVMRLNGGVWPEEEETIDYYFELTNSRVLEMKLVLYVTSWLEPSFRVETETKLMSYVYGMFVGNIQVGTFAVATKDTAICRTGKLGVCYGVYQLGNQPGYSFIFERGGYDGFSPQDVELFLEVTEVVFKSIKTYRFTDVGRLLKDFLAGRFSEVLNSPIGQA